MEEENALKLQPTDSEFSRKKRHCEEVTLVRPEGLEPPTPRSVDLPSILETEREQE